MMKRLISECHNDKKEEQMLVAVGILSGPKQVPAAGVSASRGSVEMGEYRNK